MKRASRAGLAGLACALLACGSARAGAGSLPLAAGADGGPAPPWQVVTLPKIPRHTQYRVVTADGRRVVHAAADASYATVLLKLDANVEAAPVLRWSWRVDRFPAGSDLRTRAGDDVAARACVLFDLPLERLALFDRLRIELGRRLFRQDLPAATICYVWDRTLPPGTWLANAYTDRVRMLVLRSAAVGERERWFDEQRDLHADFVSAFGAEAQGGVPPLAAIGFASDADNTGSTAVAWFGGFALEGD
jgi:hypothetical protein